MSSVFSYADESPSRWAEALGGLRSAGITRVLVPVYWGAHEPMRGVRDFSKLPRLKLEKFLQTAQSVGVQLTIELGFPGGEETFPVWTSEIPQRSLVPAAGLGRDELTYLSLPSLYADSFAEGFGDFLAEACGLVDLYRAPGGPVSDIRFNWGPYAHDVTLMENADYLAALSRRYPDVRSLNVCYGTSFPSLELACTRQAMRALTDRRAWIAVHDYRLGRRETLSRWLDAVAPTASRMTTVDAETGTLCEGSADWSIYIDPVLVEAIGAESMSRKLVPSSPGGFVTELAANACRLSEYVTYWARQRDVPVRFLGTNDSSSSQDRFHVVLAGKFLTKTAFDWLRQMTGRRHFFFPFGLPRFDENLAAIGWGLSPRGETPYAEGRLVHNVWGDTELTHPARPFEADDRLWERLSGVVALLRRKSDALG